MCVLQSEHNDKLELPKEREISESEENLGATVVEEEISEEENIDEEKDHEEEVQKLARHRRNLLELFWMMSQMKKKTLHYFQW